MAVFNFGETFANSLAEGKRLGLQKQGMESDDAFRRAQIDHMARSLAEQIRATQVRESQTDRGLDYTERHGDRTFGLQKGEYEMGVERHGVWKEQMDMLRNTDVQYMGLGEDGNARPMTMSGLNPFAGQAFAGTTALANNVYLDPFVDTAGTAAEKYTNGQRVQLSKNMTAMGMADNYELQKQSNAIQGASVDLARQKFRHEIEMNERMMRSPQYLAEVMQSEELIRAIGGMRAGRQISQQFKQYTPAYLQDLWTLAAEGDAGAMAEYDNIVGMVQDAMGDYQPAELGLPSGTNEMVGNALLGAGTLQDEYTYGDRFSFGKAWDTWRDEGILGLFGAGGTQGPFRRNITPEDRRFMNRGTGNFSAIDFMRPQE